MGVGEGKKGKNREERVGGGLSEKGVSQEVPGEGDLDRSRGKKHLLELRTESALSQGRQQGPSGQSLSLAS